MEANWKTDSSKVNFCNTYDWNVELGMKFGKKNNYIIYNKIRRKENKNVKISRFKHSTKLINPSCNKFILIIIN